MAYRQYLNQGELIFISSGDYSSYRVAGVFLVAKRFHWQETKDKYNREQKQKGEVASTYAFPAWLQQHGLIVEVDATEWHCDSAY